MHTEHEALVRSDVGTIQELVAAVERWPERLPHYRQVRCVRQDGTRRLVWMAARHHGIPLSWTCEQEIFQDRPRIAFRHVDGITNGMTAEWTFAPTSDGVHVRVVHDLLLGWPVVGAGVADWIIGPFFVDPISAKTLHGLKALAETSST